MSFNDWSTTKKITTIGSILFVLAIGSCGAFVFGLTKLLKSSDVYVAGLEHVRNNEEVKQLIGTPIEDGFMMTGNINVSGSSGQADISFSVSGPKGAGDVYVIGKKIEGLWEYSKMFFVHEASKEKINLLPDE